MTETERIRELLLAAGNGVVPRESDPVAAIGKRRGHRRLGRLVTLSAVVVLAAATVLGIAVAGGNHKVNLPPTGPIKVSKLDARLWAISQLAAMGDGDPNADDRWAVGPLPLSRADRLTSGDGPSSSLPVYVIEMRGTFTCGGCSGPPGARAPTGHVITLYVTAAAFTGEGFGLGDHWTNLNRLGRPITLIEPPGGLTQLQRHPGLALFVGDWRGHGGALRVAVTSGQLSYGGSTCLQVADDPPAPCESIEFRPSGSGVRSGPGRPLQHLLVGTIESDDAGLANGTRITLATEPNDELRITVAGRPSVPIPNPWCGRHAEKSAC